MDFLRIEIIIYMSEKLLTIGMAVHDDYNGVFFCIQALKMYHEICMTKAVEFVVIDNNPESSHGKATKKFVDSIKGRYIPYPDKVTSFTKYRVPDYATGKYILIMDAHVLLKKNAIKDLLYYYSMNPNCKDLVQGPLLYDNLITTSSNLKNIWRGDMYGIWDNNIEAVEKGDPFEIPMQGMGLLSFERSAWKGINQNFRGFGAEEGYIAEKFRQWGGKNICLPSLQWLHRFGRPEGVKFPLTLEDRVWNYFIGWMELNKSTDNEMVDAIYEHFKEKLGKAKIDAILEAAKEQTIKDLNEAT